MTIVDVNDSVKDFNWKSRYANRYVRGLMGPIGTPYTLSPRVERRTNPDHPKLGESTESNRTDLKGI